ncbi:SdrD B-like domain-containing protein, partial [Corynebacterium lehmanniae]|nr:SdrD B-like domain-containing protein [Corynebacterium lehmanniae]
SNPLSSTVTLKSGENNTSYDLGLVKPEPAPEPASVGDFVWEDSNGNGLQDEGEPPVAGVTVTVSAEGEDPRTV